MTFNWDNIRYIFQIPLEWFKRIHDRVFKAFGTNFIVVKEDTDSGGTWIDVDEDAFAQAVRGVSTQGTVTSVDDVQPDQNGNVALGAVRSIDNHTPDPNDDGNIDLTWVAKSVNNETPDANGNVSIDVGVLTVNNTSPDANGNINVSADTSTCLKQSDWMNVNSNYSVCPYSYANTGYTGNLPNAVTNIYTYTGMMNYQDLDSYITALGYQKDSDLGDLAFLDSVTVDGHASDSSGAVSFNLTASKWVKTDASGHLTTTNDTPIAIDTSQYTPQDATIQNVVTGVTWDGTNLKYSSESWTFKNGVLVNRTANADATIDTPVIIIWS